jgi:hypothetical protein
VQFIRGYPDLGAHSKLASVGKTGRGRYIPQAESTLRRKLQANLVVLRDDRIGMMRAVGIDMLDSFIDPS